MKPPLLSLSPIAKKRWRRFKKRRRAYWSLLLLSSLFAVSLASELLCNSRPLYVRYRGRHFFPAFSAYTDDTFTGSGRLTRPDYRKIANTESFKDEPGSLMLFAPHPFSPETSIDPESLRAFERMHVRIRPVPRTAGIYVDEKFRITRARSAAFFISPDPSDYVGKALTNFWVLPSELSDALSLRFSGEQADAYQSEITHHESGLTAIASLSRGRPREGRRDLLITLRETEDPVTIRYIVFNNTFAPVRGARHLKDLPLAVVKELSNTVASAFTTHVPPFRIHLAEGERLVELEHRAVSFPFRPVPPHWLGIDEAGRDVLSRVLYGMRTSMLFGLILVAAAMFFGITVGSIQGYFAGATDILGQRLIEIWSALPFLYVMIFLGDVFGYEYRFIVLIVCYGLFNWIGVSYYIRAEFLKLRGRQFVDAARCLGIPPFKIIVRHVLPNAMTPVITLFPFSLVGAIGALASLDFLGFGLPPEASSWGQLLKQAQDHTGAWWLILYPSLALFSVMLLGAFIGEGVRDAYDPRPPSRME